MAKRFSSTKGPSQRQLRAGELIRHALVEILQREGFREPALQGVSVTISEVRVSPDLKNASVAEAQKIDELLARPDVARDLSDK